MDRGGELSVYDPRLSSFVPYLGGIPASYVSYSPDHQWIAYVSYPDGTLWKSHSDGSDKLQLTLPPMGVLNPRWSPDGKSIVFMDWFASDHAAIYTVPADGGQPSLLVTGSLDPSDPTWSPDGQLIVYGGGVATAVKSDIETLDLNTMVSTKVPGSEGFYSPRLSPDGKYIAALPSEQDRLMLYDIARKQWRTLLEGTNVGWPAWSHDGKSLYTSASNKIYRVDIATGKTETVVNLEGIQWTSFALGYLGWFALTPDERIMILRDTGTEEIYALELEY